MIPRKLYMRNFMCYREQELLFAGIHLACLTGNNGHGKSAILDALTWALWGRSRLGARRDDELIHIGQREMEVEFEFALPDASAGDIRYRVLRKRNSRRWRARPHLRSAQRRPRHMRRSPSGIRHNRISTWQRTAMRRKRSRWPRPPSNKPPPRWLTRRHSWRQVQSKHRLRARSRPCRQRWAMLPL